MTVQRFLFVIDGISTWVGKAAAWLMIMLTVVVCAEVFKRYILNMPTSWIFDLNNMLYGTLFMLAGLRFAEDGKLAWTASWVSPFNGALLERGA